MGEVRRVDSWRQIFAAAGADVVELPLGPSRRPHADGIVPVAAGRAVPERLTWSGTRLRVALRDEQPDVVIVVSTRAFDPVATDGPWTLVLDLVDSLSRSYRDRADVVEGIPRRAMYRTLAAAHRRVEQKLSALSLRRVAAGWGDSDLLAAEWVPNVVDSALEPIAGAIPDHDVLFFGTLRYPPNIDALDRLARCWPTVLRARPATTALIAGAAPTGHVRELCARHQWELVADFSSLPEIAARARISVSPLGYTAGIQNKVLESAALLLPQVVTAQALRGCEPEFPLEPCADDEGFALEVVRLLNEPRAAAAQADITARHVRARYGVDSWRPWAEALIARR
jgi:polysaccharide biosynthesis protein PslH